MSKVEITVRDGVAVAQRMMTLGGLHEASLDAEHPAPARASVELLEAAIAFKDAAKARMFPPPSASSGSEWAAYEKRARDREDAARERLLTLAESLECTRPVTITWQRA